MPVTRGCIPLQEVPASAVFLAYTGVCRYCSGRLLAISPYPSATHVPPATPCCWRTSPWRPAARRPQVAAGGVVIAAVVVVHHGAGAAPAVLKHHVIVAHIGLPRTTAAGGWGKGSRRGRGGRQCGQAGEQRVHAMDGCGCPHTRAPAGVLLLC